MRGHYQTTLKKSAVGEIDKPETTLISETLKF